MIDGDGTRKPYKGPFGAAKCKYAAKCREINDLRKSGPEKWRQNRAKCFEIKHLGRKWRVQVLVCRVSEASMGGRIGRIAGRRGCAQSTTSRDSAAILAACQTLTRDGKAESVTGGTNPLPFAVPLGRMGATADCKSTVAR